VTPFVYEYACNKIIPGTSHPHRVRMIVCVCVCVCVCVRINYIISTFSRCMRECSLSVSTAENFSVTHTLQYNGTS
jgi:hypothetical protein